MALATLAITVVASAIGSVGAWCDLPFKDIVDRVDIVVLAEYRKPKGEPATVVPVKVLKGGPIDGPLALDPQELQHYRPRDGTLFLLALSRNKRVVRYITGMGVCAPVSVLPLRGTKLRREDRFNYDGGREAMTLDELKADLASHLEQR